MKRKMTLLLAAAAPTAIALIAAVLISLASGSPYSSGTHGLAADNELRRVLARRRRRGRDVVELTAVTRAGPAAAERREGA